MPGNMNKPKHGGSREGAGRKKSNDKKQSVSVRLPPDIIERLKKCNKSQEIERALRMMWGINEY
jgi:hypothetical protein